MTAAGFLCDGSRSARAVHCRSLIGSPLFSVWGRGSVCLDFNANSLEMQEGCGGLGWEKRTAGGIAEKNSNWVLTNGGESGNIRLVRKTGVLCAGSEYGGIAQLGERLNGIQEVSGSIPLISTKTNHEVNPCGLFLYID